MTENELKEYQELKEYLLANADTDREALDALQDGELLGKLNVSQSVVDELFVDIQRAVLQRDTALMHLLKFLDECKICWRTALVDLSEARRFCEDTCEPERLVQKYENICDEVQWEIHRLQIERYE